MFGERLSTGCMAERLKKEALEKEKMVDLVAGPGNVLLHFLQGVWTVSSDMLLDNRTMFESLVLLYKSGTLMGVNATSQSRKRRAIYS